MESRAKYLNELMFAIRSSTDDNAKLDLFASNAAASSDPKSLKIVTILVQNLATPLTSSDVFSKSLNALDLLLRKKPHLLSCSLDPSSDNKDAGVFWLFKRLLHIACVHWESHSYQYAIKQKIGSWCYLFTTFAGPDSKTILSRHIFGQLAGLEAQITSVFSASQDVHTFSNSCKQLYVLCDWCNQRDLQKSVPSIDTSLEANRWDNYFQRIMRIVFYVLDCVDVEQSVLLELKTKFLSLTVNYAVTRGSKFCRLRRKVFSDTAFKFATEATVNFISTNAPFLQADGDKALAKAILRLYLSVAAEVSAIQLFSHFTPFEKFYHASEPFPALKPFTKKALIIAFFDIRRKERAEKRLTDDAESLEFNREHFKDLQSVALAPYTQSPQLEALRKSIINDSFSLVSNADAKNYTLMSLKLENTSIEILLKDLQTVITKSMQQNNFRSLIYAVQLLGKISCCESNDIKGLGGLWEPCVSCDSTLPSKIVETGHRGKSSASTASGAYRLIYENFLSHNNLNDFGEALLAAIMIALRRIFTHFRAPPILLDNNTKSNLTSPFELFKRVSSTPNRYLRLLAVPLMSSWTFPSTDDTEDQQFTLLLSSLQDISVHSTTETLLMSWVRLTLASNGDNFDPLLVKLIDIFNSANVAERHMMAHQLRYVSWLKSKTPYRLLSPILPLLLKQIGKNLKEKMLSFQRLTDFVEYPAKTILENFQRYIVPYAITQYKDDVITEISNIMCDYNRGELSAQKDRLLRKNSRQIFAVALVKHSFYSIDILESLFTNCLPTFEKSFVAAYLPDYKTLAEVLKLFKNQSDTNVSKSDNENMILCSLRYLLTKLGSEKRRVSKLKLLSEWTDDQEALFQKKLQESVLGIFQVFSSDMHDIEGRTTYFEKLRVINGIHFLINNASSECIISALAQISICLQSGQEVPEVCENCLKCWFDLVNRLTQEQLSTVVDSFVPFLLQNATSFNNKVKKIANDIIRVLVNEKKDLILQTRPYITLAFVNATELKVLEENRSFARSVNRVLYTTDWFLEYSNNLKSKNKYLVRQSLIDVKALLQKKELEGLLRASYHNASQTDISILLGSLLDACYSFRNEDVELCEQCTAIIGVIGVLDTTKHHLPRSTAHMQEVYDFNDHAQTVKFLINIMNEILVPAFWESENPTKQLFVALVMQESLKFCGLSSSSWDIHQSELYPNEARLWSRFNDVAKTTLYPLRSSLYMAQSWKEYSPIEYPSFNPKQGYKTWLKNLTLDLLKTSTDESHPLHVFASLIREDDGFLSENLLPYIVIDILIKAEKGTIYCNYVDNLKQEFKFIFEFELSSLNRYQVDSIKRCYEISFKVLEYCKKWVTQFKQAYSRKHATFTIQEQKYILMLQRIEAFLEMNSFGLMAQRSLETNSFERSALYLEQSYRVKDKTYVGNESLLAYMQKTYAEIGDIDAVEGVLKVFSTGSVTSKIEELQYSHNWNMAQQCFEALGQIAEPVEKYEKLCISGNTKMLKSMFDHQQYDQVVHKLNVLATNQNGKANELPIEWVSMGVESAYLSGQSYDLQKWIGEIERMENVSDPMTLLHYNFGKVLISLSRHDTNKALIYTQQCHRIIGSNFLPLSINTTLLKIRDVILRLHALRDLWIISDPGPILHSTGDNQILKKRLKNIGADFEPRHFLLSIQKSFNILENRGRGSVQLAENYFEIAQNSRINSRPDLASGALIHALIYDYPSADLEYAEVLWFQGEHDKAIKLVAEIHQKMMSTESYLPRERARVLLKYTEWMVLSNNSVSEQIIKQYNDVIRMDSGWSDPYYSLGLYFSRLLEKRSAEGYISNGRFENKSISFFLLSFEKDVSRTREALPKVVTFWLNTANVYVTETNAARKESIKRSTEDICKKVDAAITRCPIFIWYSVLTQLLSRLLHSHKDSVQLIMSILLNLTVEYPSHILWYISVLQNSSSSSRASIGGRIAELFKGKFPNPNELVNSSDELVRHLTNVCTKDVKSSSGRSGRSLDRDFSFDLKIAPSRMAVPVSANLDMLSPTSAQTLVKFQPFRNLISIAKIGSSYKVFASLKRPKKLNFIGSNGKIYGIMCKKEDVRQDNQYMQFSTTMDFLLSKDLASRRRKLGITTYAVVSLREDCGLIEIVPNVVTLRSILVTKYDGMKIKYSLKSMHEKWQTLPSDQKLGYFKDLLSRFPPVLFEWFLETFPDAIVWYKSRNTFSRSYAVMAMVGHILGLGDRHCENILLNVETGKILHVDFDCLFEKGRRLPIPEIVPFRLTHNLEDALGIAGTEGTFNKSSQVTLKLMRENEVALVNIIETILYDRNMDHSLHKALKVVRNKIRGIDSRDGLVLSVAGQVETITQESTSEENLSRMYIGWLPFW
ncbi:LAME_0E06128g1_1 [Lachancea meyersii CBS 8951]|uniref:Serine/threonine-protein kinase MEC1 n=1 Tax=Lachancea meyersii CBS 8951 TaxID=1266667 RepID=A0A1G4JHT7_9SACH|nr:LAME_0E06128g1_1 [Lachancea meyersii CBS 8951]